MFILPHIIYVGIHAAVILSGKRTVIITNNSDTLIKVQCLNPDNHENFWGPETSIVSQGEEQVLKEALINNVRPDIRIRYYVDNHTRAALFTRQVGTKRHESNIRRVTSFTRP